MAKSYTNLLYHLVFSTRDRRPLITPDRRARLYEYVGGAIRNEGGISLGIGGIEDHVHILAKLRPDKALSDLLRTLKANSSGWMHDVFPAAKNFYWQNGYGAFSVSSSQVPVVSNYIANQDRHHKNTSFRDEFIQILRAHKVEFDEKYLWK
ncbi:MAG: IS200/IS605 family transposase [Acidobacteria bacterium]|nr:MAG: IS200/IS605 family transposase [Acidobacteriota bacterium]